MSGKGLCSHSIYGHGIVHRQCIVKKYSGTGSVVFTLDVGTLIAINDVRKEDLLFCVINNDGQSSNFLLCKKADILSIPESLWGPILTVERSRRLPLVQNKDLAFALGGVTIGSSVKVLGSDDKSICTGIVMFKNFITRLGVGVYFGVRIKFPKDNLQVIRDKVSIIEQKAKGFPRGCDVVVCIDKIRPIHWDDKLHKMREKEKLARTDSHDEKNLGGKPKPVPNNDEKNLFGKSKPVPNNDEKNLFGKSKPVPNNDEKNLFGKSKPVPNNDENLFGKSKPVPNNDENLFGKSKSVPNNDEKNLVAKSKSVSNNDEKNLVDKSKSVSDAKEKSQMKYTTNPYDNTFESYLEGDNQEIPIHRIPLSVGEEVIYLMGNVPQKGIVRWLGFINRSVKVGIEFENPIGSGTGTANGIELFKAKYLHAGLFPPEALIKSSDFEVTNPGDDDKHNATNDDNRGNARAADAPGCSSRMHDDGAGNAAKISQNSDGSYLVEDADYACGTCGENSQECTCSYSTEYSVYSSEAEYSEEFLDIPEENKSDAREAKAKGNDFAQKKAQESTKTKAVSASKKFFDFFHSNRNDVASTAHVEKLKVKKTSSDSPVREKRSDSAQGGKKNTSHPHGKDARNRGAQAGEEKEVSGEKRKSNNRKKLSKKLDVGSDVELLYKGVPLYGTIRWIGTLPYKEENRVLAGIEMERESVNFTDGTYLNKQYFKCSGRRAHFIPLTECQRDRRFLDIKRKCPTFTENEVHTLGRQTPMIIRGKVAPINQSSNVELICGKNRGIQGHHNSCYLDATLFSMFAFTCVFDNLLFRPPSTYDIPQYTEVQRVLKEEIVNPLRKNLYVRADQVMKLRTLLEKLSTVRGLTSEEKDPEEFLYSLLAQILKAEPFLKLNSGQETFHYQLFVEKDETLLYPSVQQLFEQSFLASDLKLAQIPPVMIIQMPRFGKSYKMYSRIFPPPTLDITDVLDNSPRQCTVCGNLASYECKDCFGQSGMGGGLESTSFCQACIRTAHGHQNRISHTFKAIEVPYDLYEIKDGGNIPRIHLELFAVVCIETSHYVAFVKCGQGTDAPWCFFDSMADRQGEKNGYNIPEVVPLPDLPYWLSEEGIKALSKLPDERQLPKHAKRLLCDAYMCMYQSHDAMMYR